MLIDAPLAWVALAVGVMLVGLAKTALPGVGILPVVIFAAVLPARQSTGVLLVLLIVADIVAVVMYRANVDWASLRRLVPSVAVGIVLGSALLLVLDNEALRRMIGVILIVLVVTGLVRWLRPRLARKTARPGLPRRHSRARSWLFGVLGGATTMVANAAGPVMSIYFLASGFSVAALLGTSAWYYFVINLSKLPFSIALGLVTPSGLLIDLMLLPALAVGAIVGRVASRRINRQWFELVIYIITFASALYLLLSS
ncbi:MAG: sulfite exporter TauE/SafE family protein [Rhodoglobus sp.]|nr:sulfite exporter TauE/SafE family protein [Rhodoglobus sp.]